MEQRGVPAEQPSGDDADQSSESSQSQSSQSQSSQSQSSQSLQAAQPAPQWQVPQWQPPRRQPPGWQPPQRQASQKPTVLRLTAILGSVGGLLLGLVIGAAGHSSSKTETTASGATAVTSTVTATVTTQAPAAAPAAVHTSAAAPSAPSTSAAPKPAVVFTTSGDGIKNTATFTTGPEWSVAYTFDCSSAGGKGNFVLSVGSDLGDILANALAAKGSDTSYEHSNPGSHYLQVNSECDWTLKVSND